MPLPDPRLNELAKMFESEKIVHAPVTFVDIAGIVKGASEGAGLGNKFLANIRESDAICQVVRVFTDDDVAHVDGRIDPKSDIEVIETELILADLQTLERAVPRLEKEARTHKDRRPAHDAAVAAQEILDGGTTLFAAGQSIDVRVAARAEPDDDQAVPLRVQRRRGGAHRCRPARGSAGDGRPGRRGVPRREDRGRAAGARRRVGRRAAGVDRPDRARSRRAGPRRLPHAAAADVPHGRARRSHGRGRFIRATPRRRPPASSTPTSRRASSRPRSSPTTT